ncbi:hypothetical protein [Neobacillus vireti]|nr:hypothetical protein [Neobacillus vireti]
MYGIIKLILLSAVKNVALSVDEGTIEVSKPVAIITDNELPF